MDVTAKGNVSLLSFLIRGDSFYIDDKGEPALPVGTLVITEKAPEGYHIKSNNDYQKYKTGKFRRQ